MYIDVIGRLEQVEQGQGQGQSAKDSEGTWVMNIARISSLFNKREGELGDNDHRIRRIFLEQEQSPYPTQSWC